MKIFYKTCVSQSDGERFDYCGVYLSKEVMLDLSDA